MTGIQMTHVPYRGTAPALHDLLGGQVQMVFCTIPSAIQYIKAGTLRAIAVTSATRLESMPEIPTVGDTVPRFETAQWYGVGVSGRLPSAFAVLITSSYFVGACTRRSARFLALESDDLRASRH